MFHLNQSKWTESTSTTEPYIEKAESVGYLKVQLFEIVAGLETP